MAKRYLLRKMAAAACVIGLMGSVGGCKPKKGTANPDDYYPLILVALEGGKTAAMIGRNEAIKAENFAGCVTSEVMIAATDAASATLAGKLGGKVVIPGLNVDLADCMPLNPKDPKGNEDVGVIVEQVVGVALGLGSHYAAKLESQDCKKAKAALGAIAYLQGLVGPVADEISDPDGVFTVPATEIPLGECGEAAPDDGSNSEGDGDESSGGEEPPAEEAAEEKPAEDPADEAPAEEAPADSTAPAPEAPAEGDGG
jgi:hypothetical protein